MPERLIECLVGRGVLSPESAEEALERQVLMGGALDTALFELGLADEVAVLDAMAEAFGLDVARPEDATRPVDGRALRALPEQWAKKHRIAPLEVEADGRTLAILTPAPADVQLVVRLGELLELTIRPVLAPEFRVEQRLSLLYDGPPSERHRDLIASFGGTLPAPEPVSTEDHDALDFASAVAKLRDPTSRDHIARTALRHVGKHFELCALFIVQEGFLDGWLGRGPGSEVVPSLSVPIEKESAFRVVLDARAHYLGPLAEDGSHARFVERLGRPHPRTVLIVPLRIRDRTVALFYAENGKNEIPTRVATDVMLFMTHVQASMLTLLHRRKAASFSQLPAFETAEPKPPEAPPESASPEPLFGTDTLAPDTVEMPFEDLEAAIKAEAEAAAQAPTGLLEAPAAPRPEDAPPTVEIAVEPPTSEPSDLPPIPELDEPAPIPSEPAPVPSEPAPVPSEPAPIPSEPAPIPSEPAPPASEPAPPASEPAPVPSEPAPIPSEPAPIPSEPAPVPSEPAPVPSEPAPIPSEPAPPASEPAPPASEPGPIPSEPAPLASEPATLARIRLRSASSAPGGEAVDPLVEEGAPSGPDEPLPIEITEPVFEDEALTEAPPEDVESRLGATSPEAGGPSPPAQAGGATPADTHDPWGPTPDMLPVPQVTREPTPFTSEAAADATDEILDPGRDDPRMAPKLEEEEDDDDREDEDDREDDDDQTPWPESWSGSDPVVHRGAVGPGDLDLRPAASTTASPTADPSAAPIAIDVEAEPSNPETNGAALTAEPPELESQGIWEPVELSNTESGQLELAPDPGEGTSLDLPPMHDASDPPDDDWEGIDASDWDDPDTAEGSSTTIPDLGAEAWLRASSETVRPRPLPSEVIERAGRPSASPPESSEAPETPPDEVAFEREVEGRLTQLEHPMKRIRGMAREALAAMGPPALPHIAERFPGPLAVNPFAPEVTLPPFPECGPLLSLMAHHGREAHPHVLSRLDAPDPIIRFFATYFYSAVYVPEAVPRLVQRLHDEEARICMTAARTLFRYRSHSAFSQVLEHLHGRLSASSVAARRHATYLIGLFRDVTAVPELIAILERRERALLDVTEAALSEITKQGLGTNPRKWRSWWKKNEAKNRIEWLIEGLASRDGSIRRSARDELRAVTGMSFGYEPEGPKRQREQARQRWATWWKEQGAEAMRS